MEEIDDIRTNNFFPPPCAASLRGKLQFAENNTNGRALASKFRIFQQRATGELAGNLDDDVLKGELVWARQFTLNCRPRILKAGVRHY